MAKKEKDYSKSATAVLTIRIDEELDQVIDKICEKKRMPKAALIRSYLEMSKYIIIDRASIKSLDNRDFIILKKSFIKSIIKNLDELGQIDLGEKLARFINDTARIQGKLDDIEYKLDLCEHLGFFPKFIDDERYILFSNKFGPKKFVESFVWNLINQKEFNPQFIETEMEKSKSIRGQYNKEISPVDRLTSHYAFEFAKLTEPKPEEESK